MHRAIRGMAALFPPWTNTAFRLAILAIVLGAASLIVVPMVYARSPFATHAGQPILQPIAFDHRHHVKDDGIQCLYCHENAARGPYAGVPDTNRCMGCHSQIWNDSATLAPLRASARTGEPIHWKRVHSLPDFVYFDHSIHVTNGIECATCHGEVENMAAVYQVEPLTMQWCVDCHRDPTSHVGKRNPPLRSLTHCSTCHR